MSWIVLTLQGLVFFGYLAFIYKKFGILDSISDSYYSLPDNLKFLFVLFTWSMGLTLYLIGNETHIYWFFASAALISLVGVASQFKLDTLIADIHSISALLSVVCGMVGLMYQHVFFPFPIAALACMYIYFKKLPNHIWWMEVSSYALIFAGFVSQLL